MRAQNARPSLQHVEKLVTWRFYIRHATKNNIILMYDRVRSNASNRNIGWKKQTKRET